MIQAAQNWPENLADQSALQHSLHEPHWKHRAKVISALQEGYQKRELNTAARMNECGRGASFFIDPDQGKVRPWLSRCHHRLCPFCAVARSMRVSIDIQKLMADMKHPRSIVLTVKSTDRPLKQQLRDLRRNFAVLRRNPEWKKRVLGGVYTMEITQNEETGLWHPHLHVIYDGEYFAQRQLRFLWNKVTGNAHIIWIQNVLNQEGMANELAKYIGKVQHVEKLDHRSIREYAEAVNGQRLVQTFGQCHGKTVKDSDDQRTEAPDEYKVRLGRLTALAREGFHTPMRLVLAIADRFPIFAKYLHQLAPQMTWPAETERHAADIRAAIRNGKAPPRLRSVATDNQEQLDATMFIQFTRFRAEEAEGLFEAFDMGFRGADARHRPRKRA